MSLQGTLETIPLSDVLSLLAATKKTGELRVNGGDAEGRLWLAGGEVVGGAVPRAHTPVDAVFELLRLTTGTFVFDSEATAPKPAPPVPVAALLADAQARLDVWRSIEAVVPSVRCLVSLAPALERDEVKVSRQQWKELVAVAAGPDVQGVMEKLALGEFDASRTVKELVDAGLAQVAPAPAPAEAEPAAAPSPASDAKPEPAPKAATPADPAGTAAAPAPSRLVPPSAGPGSGVTPRPSRPALVEASDPTPPRRPGSTMPPRRPVADASASAPAAGGPSSEPPRNVPDQPVPARQPSGSAATRPIAALPSRDEAEDLVHQLAALSTHAAAPKAAPPKPGATRDAAPPQATAAGKAAPPEAPAGEDEAGDRKTEAGPSPSGRPSEEEPINRGMLLKFLSSVRP